MIRDDETVTLDQIFQRYAEAESNALDRKLIEHLAKTFFLDKHFIKWFKSNYDFYIAIDHTQTTCDYLNYARAAQGDFDVKRTISYRFQGPDRVPFKERFKRKIRKLLRRLR